MTDEELGERVVASREIYRGSYLSVRVDTVRDQRGRDHQRDIVEHPGAVAILPLLGDDLLLVRQFRSPIRQVLLELPAGGLDRGPDGSAERPQEAAVRELHEETGHLASRWRWLGSFFTAPGFTSEELHLFLAQDLVPVDDYAGPMTDERLALVRLPWRDAVRMAERGEVHDAKSLVGLFWLDRLARDGSL